MAKEKAPKLLGPAAIAKPALIGAGVLALLQALLKA
jgi:hypothetical protein